MTDETPKMEQADTLINPYEVLGLERPASAAAIKKAYFAKVREHPPERDAAAFKRIRAAYDALRTPEAKAATDLFLLHHAPDYEPYKRPPTFNLDFRPGDRALLARTGADMGDLADDFRDIRL